MSSNSPQPGTNWYSRYEGFLRNKQQKPGSLRQGEPNFVKSGIRQPDAQAANIRKGDADLYRDAIKRKLTGMRPGPVNGGRK